MEILAKVTHEKDIGIYITDDAKPSLQCVAAAKKHLQALGFINKTFTYEPCHEKTCFAYAKANTQISCNREADQRLCFRYTDRPIPFLSKSEISRL